MDKKIMRKKERKGKERKGGMVKERERIGLRTAALVLFGLNKSEVHTH